MITITRTLLAACFSLLVLFASAQTPINGTVNDYTEVTAVNCAANEVTVASTTGFSVGDKVIIIQMTGVQMDQTNSSSFGQITDAQYAGNYEVLTIDNITGTTIHFQYQILRDYDPSGGQVQLVRMPVYTNADVTSMITCPAWNGTTGGVIAIECSGTLSLKTAGPTIFANGMGFQGSTVVQDNSTGCGSDWPDYFYGAAATDRGAPKGEGIADFISNKEGGRGAQVTGGGGGNDHNAGGGGGALYGSGGDGGVRECIPTPWWCGGGVSNGNYNGIGGYAIDTLINNTYNRIFMGGGGGAGHDNNTNAGCDAAQSEGGSGGGIIIIRANTFDFGASQDVTAAGTKPPMAACDGSGGGGAGGMILMEVNTFVSTKRLFANGAKGGDNFAGAGCSNSSPTCMGPGGGGGGGVIWFSGTPTIGAFDIAQVNGGLKGDQNNTDCNGGTATAGGNGAILNNLVIPESSVNPNGCTLPVGYANFTGKKVKNKIALNWSTTFEVNSDYFEVQRAVEDGSFRPLAKVQSKGNGSTYQVFDADPGIGMNMYRLKQFDLDGRFTYSDQIAINYEPGKELVQSVFPNPLGAGRELNVVMYMRETEQIEIKVHDLMGKQVFTERKSFGKGKHYHKIRHTVWPEGVYVVSISNGKQKEIRRIVVTP